MRKKKKALFPEHDLTCSTCGEVIGKVGDPYDPSHRCKAWRLAKRRAALHKANARAMLRNVHSATRKNGGTHER